MTSKVEALIRQHETQDPFEKFIGSMKNQKTQGSYAKEVKDFASWIGLDFNELLELGEKNQPTLTDKVGEYIDHILTDTVKKNGAKYGYGKGKWIKKSILKFYSVNHIKISIDRSDQINTLTKIVPTKHRKFTKIEIQKLLHVCPNDKLRSLICFQKDSGLRVSDLTQIRYKDVKEGVFSDDGFGSFILLDIEKTDKTALVCFGFETSKYLKLWLPELEKELGRPLLDTDFIFCHLKKLTLKGNQLNADSLDRIINNQINKLGFKGELSSNALRYYFESALETTSMNKNLILKIQGKQIGDSTKHYSKHDCEEMLNVYRPVYSALVIEEQGNPELKSQLESLQEQTENQNQLINEQIKAYNLKMGEMEEEIKRLRQANEERDREQARKELFGDENQTQAGG
ncbi:MAG: tyrosine-type recombinase/integrase [Candidatus Bathyarchaeia archaeon]|jgi:integrase